MKLAILGVTGAVGRTMLEVLQERAVDIDEIVPIASERSAGTTVRFRGREWTVRTLADDAFSGCGIALFSAGARLSQEWAPRAAAAGAVVVDNSSAWRMADDVPLVVPEVNAARISERPRGIIANPNCSTIQVVVALEALRRAAGLEQVVASTYQSVSGAGQTGLDALRAEQAGGDTRESPFGKRIAGNVVPRIGSLLEGGWTQEEVKMRAESRKILGLPGLRVAATCVRVPVEVGHGVSCAVRTSRPLSLAEARQALRAMPGLQLVEDGDPTPLDVAGTDDVRVGRLRVDPDEPETLHLWIVADNLRKGAASNAVQIAECVTT